MSLFCVVFCPCGGRGMCLLILIRKSHPKKLKLATSKRKKRRLYNKQKWIIIGSAHKTMMMMMTMSFNTTTTASCSQQLASSQKTSVRGGRANNKLRAQKHAIARQNGRRASSLVVCDGTGKFVVGGNWKCMER